jgi:2-dehydropantoate 2-reductase
MDILVYGAGVVGSVYAARLQGAGHRITVLARGVRLAKIREHGLILEDVSAGVRSACRVLTTHGLRAGDSYDVAVIAVRCEQLGVALRDLAANRNIPVVIFMVNNPAGPIELVNALGVERVVLGFSGVGGALEGHVVRYVQIAQQSTTVGGVGGRKTVGVELAAGLMRDAGLPVRIESDMEAWLTAHAFFVTCVCGALYLEGADCGRLSRSREGVGLMVDGVREGFGVMRRLGRRVHPLGLKVMFCWMPRGFAVSYWRRFFSESSAEYSIAGHARHAVEEMRTLAVECRRLASLANVSTPALERLYRAVDDYAEGRL